MAKTNEKQTAKFKALARETECDSDEESFDRKLTGIARAAVSPAKPAKSKGTGGAKKKR